MMDVSSEASSVVFLFSVEEDISREEMDLFPWLLEGDEDYNSFVARFRIQALLSLRRISSQANHDRPCYLYLKSVSKFGSDLSVQEVEVVVWKCLKTADY